MKHVIVGKLRGVNSTRKYGLSDRHGCSLQLEVPEFDGRAYSCFVPEEDAEGLKIGQTIQVTIETLPEEGG